MHQYSSHRQIHHLLERSVLLPLVYYLFSMPIISKTKNQQKYDSSDYIIKVSSACFVVIVRIPFFKLLISNRRSVQLIDTNLRFWIIIFAIPDDGI